MTPLLSLENLNIRRGKVEILRGITWQMQRGEHWVILGANGSGKTSLLATLMGYLSFSGGRISLLGQTYGECDWPEIKKRIGFVSSSIRQSIPDEEEAQITVMTGRKAVIGHWGRMSRTDSARAGEILAMLGCEALARRPWLVLSQGERQQVLIGRALMANPDLLILDEPCAGLDPVAREDFLQRVQALTQEKKTPGLILVTHHVEEIVPGFSHILLLQKGSVFASGPIDEVLTSENLGAIFNRPLELHSQRGRYQLTVASSSGVS
ncbi:MAG TPA: ATP-binding cassette domain-containing protein [Chthoniobacterales bacterium]|jgi:iron complex transport system ATP-binding protein